MNHCGNTEGDPFGNAPKGVAKTGAGRGPQKSVPFDCPSAIEERETRYFEYQPVVREQRKPK